MYGCPCYKHNNRLFAFLVTDGIVLTRIGKQEIAELENRFPIRPFQARKRTMKGWPQIDLDATTDLDLIIPFIRRSYDLSKN